MGRLLFAHSLASKGLVVGASVIIHGGLALAAGAGFPGRARATEAAPIELSVIETNVDLEVAPPHPPEPEEPPDLPTNVAAPAHHTHPYPVPADHDAHPHDPRIEHVHPAAGAPGDHDHDHDLLSRDHDGLHDAQEPAPAAAGDAHTAPEDAPPRFSLTVGTNMRAAGGVVAAAGAGEGGHGIAATPGTGAMPGAGPSEIVPESGVSTRARAVVEVEPVYPPVALGQQVEADVLLEIVVDAAGRVLDARVSRRAGYGFDEAALTAIRRFRFSPAQRDGRAVHVRMPWMMRFRLK